MKSRIISAILSLALIFIFSNAASFAQNKPEKKDVKTETKVEQPKVTSTQKEMKTETKTTAGKTETVKKEGSSMEPVSKNGKTHKTNSHHSTSTKKETKEPIKEDSKQKMK